MNRPFLGLAALAITLLTAAHGIAATRASKTLDVRVGGVSIEQGKVRAALLSGEQQGILPGDKGYFTKDGAKVPGSDFEVQRVGGRLAWTMAPFPTIDQMRFKTSLTTRVTTPQRTCTEHGVKNAKVVSTQRENDSAFYFTLDKGAEDGLLPSSNLAKAGRDGDIELTWVGANSAGGYIRNVSNPDQAAQAFKGLAYSNIVCKAK